MVTLCVVMVVVGIACSGGSGSSGGDAVWCDIGWRDIGFLLVIMVAG